MPRNQQAAELQQARAGEMQRTMNMRRGLGAPVRRSFLRSTSESTSKQTPLLTLMHARGGGNGGRGPTTRLALLLSLLWISPGGSHEIHRPSSFLAELTGFEYQPRDSSMAIDDMRVEHFKVAAINGALGALEERNFIRIEPGDSKGAKPRRIKLNREDLIGLDYTIPDGFNDPYIRVPETLWTTGTLSRLTAPGIAMYLILLDIAGREPEPLVVSAKHVKDRYGLSDSTRKRGIKNLEESRVIGITRERALGPDERRRSRNVIDISFQFYPNQWRTDPTSAEADHDSILRAQNSEHQVRLASMQGNNSTQGQWDAAYRIQNFDLASPWNE